jgi:two-component system cell cycle sensor histidine kinase/response regulator CckA
MPEDALCGSRSGIVTAIEPEVSGRTDPKAAPTVMLLDDDANTLLALHCVLERTRANVIECEDEDTAETWCKRLHDGIDLLVADVVLRNSNGPQVVRNVKPSQPLMRLLYISGYSLNELSKRGLLRSDDISPGRVDFLQKPFSPAQFLEKVEELLAN